MPDCPSPPRTTWIFVELFREKGTDPLPFQHPAAFDQLSGIPNLVEHLKNPHREGFLGSKRRKEREEARQPIHALNK
jgi:hypothetical protein